MSDREPIVRLVDAHKAFEEGRLVALKRVDLEVRRGEFVAITGPSGSGKTTLLNLIGAMDVPTSGEVYLDGIRLNGTVDLDAVRATRIGFIFQMHNLIPVLTAEENVEVAMIPRRMGRAVRRERARDLLAQVGLASRVEADVRVLSGGERQRVAIARAMANEPTLLLADEPTGNLDSHTGAEVIETLKKLQQRTGAALILVTHNEKICQGADHRWRMQDGELEEIPA